MVASIDLADLNGTNDFVINGIDDLVISALSANPNGNSNAEESYVVFGGANVGSSGSLELCDLDGTNGFVINSINKDDLSRTRIQYSESSPHLGFREFSKGEISFAEYLKK